MNDHEGNKVIDIKSLPAYLGSVIWQFSKHETEPFTKCLKFNAHGKIGGYRTEYEAGWRIEDERELVILGLDGAVTSKFTLPEGDLSDVRKIEGQSVAFPGLPLYLEFSPLQSLFDDLTSRVYRFGTQTGISFTNRFQLLPDLSVSDEYPAYNERYWELKDDEILVFDGDYKLTSRYALPTSLSVDSLHGHSVRDEGVSFVLSSVYKQVQGALDLQNSHVSLSGSETAFRIQNVVMPDKIERESARRELYYKGNNVGQFKDFNVINGKSDFSSYLNTVSLSKWKQYTNAKSIFLKLVVSGDFKLKITKNRLQSKIPDALDLGLSVAIENLARSDVDDIFKRNAMNYQSVATDVVTSATLYDISSAERLTLEIPVDFEDADNLLAGFEIEGQAAVFDAAWYAVVEKANIRDARIALSTTTFQKETYIRRNLQLIHDEIFQNTTDELGLNKLGDGHLFVNVVDNGRTLSADEVNSTYVRLYGNPNVGGAGGFTRGMIETLELQKNGEFSATHLLFMDDDIEVLPESFKRTFALLSLVDDKHSDHFIEGAMLDSIDGITQYEDTGFITHSKETAYMPVKDRYDLTSLKDILRNNLEYPLDNQYAAWWYCVAPIKFVHENSMSLPIFYRGDDIEFSIRNNAKIMTMNGLAVWHLPFYTKKSKALENYLVCRNSFIGQSVNENFVPSVSYIDKYLELYKKEIRMFNYNAADQVLDALDDYLKGPDYIASLDGLAKIREVSKKNEVFSDEIPPEIKRKLGGVDEYRALNPHDQQIFMNTDNGHGLPAYVHNRYDDDLQNVEVINHEMLENPGKQFMRKRIAVYDTYNKVFAMRERDQGKYETVQKRFHAVMHKYNQEGAAVASEYRNAAKRFHNKDFWLSYLGLNQ